MEFYRASSGWVIVGPAAQLSPGATVTARRRDGTTKAFELVAVGRRTFMRDGQVCAYGYFEHEAAAPPPANARRVSPVRYLQSETGQLVRFDPRGANSPLARAVAKSQGLLSA